MPMDNVAIVKCSNYSVPTVKNAMMASFDLMGGADQYIKPGETLLLKPNLIVASKGDRATTDARFVEAAIEIIKEQHATPVIGDSPAFGSAKGVAKSVGILEVMERQGVELVEFKKNITFSEGVRITKSLKDFDKVVNLPKLKAHSQVRFTGATKNLFGLTKGKMKVWQHMVVRNDLEKFCRMILRLYDQARPDFTLVDAIDIMEGTGPRGGSMKRFGFIFSGVNCLSIDTVMARCLRLDIDKVPLLQTAIRNGYKGLSLEEIDVKGEPIENVMIEEFAYPETLNNISFSVMGAFRSVFRHLWLLCVKERR